LVATAEEMASFATMFEQFKAYSPTFNGPISPAESVKAQMKVIENATIKDSGAFVSHHGSKIWL
jgi:hypothetical protein